MGLVFYFEIFASVLLLFLDRLIIVFWVFIHWFIIILIIFILLIFLFLHWIIGISTCFVGFFVTTAFIFAINAFLTTLFHFCYFELNKRLFIGCGLIFMWVWFQNLFDFHLKFIFLLIPFLFLVVIGQQWWLLCFSRYLWNMLALIWMLLWEYIKTHYLIL